MKFREQGIALWALGWIGLIGLQLGSGRLGDRPIGSITVLFWIVVIAASGCVATSLWLVRRALDDDSAELGLIAAYAHGVSVLPLVHGLTLPGVFYGPNDATTSAVAIALPLAAIAGSPLLITRRNSLILLHWRRWVIANIVAQTIVAATLLTAPGWLPDTEPGSRSAIALAVTSIAVSVAISARHMRLFAISQRPAVLATSLAFALVASANLVWVNGSDMTIGFWLAHALDIVGVFGMTIIAAVAYRRSRVERDVFRPLTLRDPLDALEFGLDPVVREFVADLERKDPITADHVRRTAEAATVIGVSMGLHPEQVRIVGLGALLHDVGKLRIDVEVLQKPGRLTDTEFEHIRQHTVLGEALVLGSPALADIAPIVRHHHERIDGNGYPDGLLGDDIPMLARIVSVCDAYDAMTHSRQYREGMDADLARGILVEHAGSQWDQHVVDALLTALDRDLVPAAPTVLAPVGALDDCSCLAPAGVVSGG